MKEIVACLEVKRLTHVDLAFEVQWLAALRQAIASTGSESTHQNDDHPIPILGKIYFSLSLPTFALLCLLFSFPGKKWFRKNNGLKTPPPPLTIVSSAVFPARKEGEKNLRKGTLTDSAH